jgi:hypothetical protein
MVKLLVDWFIYTFKIDSLLILSIVGTIKKDAKGQPVAIV